MRVAIIYSSKTGNTKMVAEAIKEQLEQEDIIYFGEPSEELPEADIYFMGSWTDKGSASSEMTEFIRKMQNKKIAYFGTAGDNGDNGYYELLFSKVKENIDVSNEILGSFFCQGKMPPQIRGAYEKMLEENSEDERAKKYIANFDAAISRPNEADLLDAKEWAKKCIKES